MPSAMTEIENVCRFFSTKDIKISPNNEWLKSCIEWFKSENDGCSSVQIQEFAYQQILLADLCIIDEGCLPSTIKQARFIKLPGKYLLQVNYLIDVGKSAYSQYQTLRKHSTANLEVTEEVKERWEPKPNRMLKMELTDGKNVVFGMEYSPIKKINTNLVPGSKIIVKGPVECRNGIILLQENNVSVLGGEVDSLYECNHYNRMITKKLNLDEHLLPIDENVPDEIQPISCNLGEPTNSIATNFNNPFQQTNSTSNQQPQIHNPNDFFDDSDIFLNLPVDNIVMNDEIPGNAQKKRVIEVNASVTAFKSKLIIKDGNWHVLVRINSEDNSMKASFDPDLLDRLIGFSPAELNSKESEIAVNPAIKERMNEMLKRGQQVIKNLKCNMTLVHEQGAEFPVIISISDESAFYDPSHD